MIREKRVIPVLLSDGKGLIKTRRFTSPIYLGDPLNALRIFSEKEVDELMLLDVMASARKSEPNFKLIERCAAEAFMPLGYGGGIATMAHVERLVEYGIEKLIFNSALELNPLLVGNAAKLLGSQAVVASIDYHGSAETARVAFDRGTRRTNVTPKEAARSAQESGAGEIMLTSIDREGCRVGFDTATIQDVASEVSIPVIAHGGADKIADLGIAGRFGASALAAGSLFTLRGKYRAMLITYPSEQTLRSVVG